MLRQGKGRPQEKKVQKGPEFSRPGSVSGENNLNLNYSFTALSESGRVCTIDIANKI